MNEKRHVLPSGVALHKIKLEAQRFGVTFLGFQELGTTEKAMLYQDHVTGTSFALHENEILEMAIVRVHAMFYAADIKNGGVK